ncbi:ABC transporter substrate-binding protein [Microbacterium tumbae]
MSFRRLTLATATTAVAALLLAGCAADASPNQETGADTLVWGRPDPMTTWEGDRCVTSVPTNLMVFDSLLRISADGLSVEPGLAESYEYDDSTYTYTFALRPDAAFSNGDPLTAEDVVFSIDQWKSGELSGVYYEQIDSATAVDDSVIEVQMKQPDTFLPALLTWCTSNVYPVDFAGLTAEEFFASPIGAGPFQIEETEDLGGANERVVLSPNPEYWNADAIEVAGLEIVTIGDGNQRVLRFQSGDLQIVEGLGDAELRQLDSGDLVRTTPQIWNGIALNTRSDMLGQSDVRRAFAQAIDREAIVSALGEGAIPTQGILPTNLPDMVGPDDPAGYDPEAARRTLEAAGIDRPLQYLYNPSDAVATTIANVVQAQLSEIGVKVELIGADAATIRTLGDEGTSWDLVSTSASAISPSAFDPIGLMLADHYPKTASDTTVLAEQLAIGMAASDSEARTSSIKEIQNDAAAQAALIGIADIPQVYAVSSAVQGFAPLPEQLWYPDGVSY